MITISTKRQSQEGRALRQFTLSTGKSAGRNSSGRITVFHLGGGSKRLQRRIDLKRSTSSMGIVERIEYDPNRSSRIHPVRWIEGVRQRKCKTQEEFAPKPQILEPTTTTIRGLFSFSSPPGKVDQRKVASFSPGRMAAYVVVGLPTTRMPPWSRSPDTSTRKGAGSKKTCAKDLFFSAFSSQKTKGETASLSFGSSFAFPRVAVAGAKPAFFAPRMREKVRGKKTFSLCEVRKWRTHSILWAHRMKGKAALSWRSFRRQETLGLVGGAEHKESKAERDQGSLPAKPIGEGPKDGACKVNRVPVTYLIASHKCSAGKMVMNCDWSKPSTSDLLRPAQNGHTY
ncbi:ribosomal protein L2 (mitochondrion) [Cucumis sativus]|uniref:60S ribosomal protein L2, mitochondrial n=1 Tax=Cucumis sativus TaxID=3659 RepID=G3EIZ1_CUCSA|nr:ribosomal protein L2 [Cucumis sativus]ADZ10766.1 ribosomal protein L2 [Cucumis sativus]UGO88404.1 ribosomal protein L2 [Cucumis hystrix]